MSARLEFAVGPCDDQSVRLLSPRFASVLAVAAALLVAGCGGSGSSGIQVQGQGPVPKGLQGVVQSPPQPKPDFTLTDTSGQPFNLATQTQGYVTLLYFGYTYCPDVCPTHMANIAAALKKLGAQVNSHIKVVFVTTDPPRDTRAVLRAWLDNFSTAFIGLTGTQAQIESAETASGLQPAYVDSPASDAGGAAAGAGPTTTAAAGNYSVTHASQVLAFTTDNLAHIIYPAGFGLKTWVHDLPELARGWPRS